MKAILDRFDFWISESKMDSLSWTIVIVAWLVVVVCSLGSVIAHGNRFTTRQRWFWFWMIVGIPFFGVLAYLPASVLKDGYSILKTTKKQNVKKISAS